MTLTCCSNWNHLHDRALMSVSSCLSVFVAPSALSSSLSFDHLCDAMSISLDITVIVVSEQSSGPLLVF